MIEILPNDIVNVITFSLSDNDYLFKVIVLVFWLMFIVTKNNCVCIYQYDVNHKNLLIPHSSTPQLPKKQQNEINIGILYSNKSSTNKPKKSVNITTILQTNKIA